jgi:NAD(P)H-hydrate epimerase
MPRNSKILDSITSREMRALETNGEYYGVPRLLLMENAGHAVASEVASRHKPNTHVLVYCGLGGNGGDGFVAARHLLSMGFKVTVILAGKGNWIVDKDALQNWEALQPLKNSISIFEVYDSTLIPDVEADVAIDALLGIGTKGNLKPPILQLVRKINSMKTFRIAVDVPTGIDSDTGEALGEAVKADLTLTFHKTKRGLEKAKKHVGNLIIKDIGLPKQFETFAGPGDVLMVTKPRPPESHKGDFGRLLVIGGSETYVGAPTFVAQAALRTGVDLVYVATPEKTAYAISAISPDLITIKLEGTHLTKLNLKTLKEHIKNVNAVVLGPGLGLHDETKETVKALVETVEKARKPLLLDADGLKAFAGFKRKLKVPLVLTPHAGEYAILTGRKLPEDIGQRIIEVQKSASQLGAVILTKGAIDLISEGDRYKLNFTGNAGMTVGGTGDVLSGIVGALLAQGIDSFEAAVAGAFVNGAAGDFVACEKGYHMVASDLLDWIPRVFNDPMSHLKVRNKSGRPS